MTGEDIINEINNSISNFYNSLYSLNEDCINYQIAYDEYLSKTVYDSSLIKEKMKDAIIKGSKHDI